MVENLSLGTLSWNNQAWQAFYPEDLPEDWQIDYYSHYFSCVLVPEDQWRTWDEDQMSDLAEALAGENFEFFFELKQSFDETVCTQLNRIKSTFETLAVGILLKGAEQPLPDSLRDYQLTLFSESDCLPGWHWQNEQGICSGYPLGYVSHFPIDGKLQASCLKSFMDSLVQGQAKANFVVGDENCSIESVQNLKIIAEVMGF